MTNAARLRPSIPQLIGDWNETSMVLSKLARSEVCGPGLDQTAWDSEEAMVLARQSEILDALCKFPATSQLDLTAKMDVLAQLLQEDPIVAQSETGRLMAGLLSDIRRFMTKRR